MDALLVTITLLDKWMKGMTRTQICESAYMNLQWDEVGYLWRTYVRITGTTSGM